MVAVRGDLPPRTCVVSAAGGTQLGAARPATVPATSVLAIARETYSTNRPMANRTIAPPVRLTQTEYAVLATLGHFGGEASGYDLKKFVERALGYLWGPSKTHLYAVLRRLVDAGLATRRTVSQTSKPNKQLYRITQTGRAVVREWLELPETETDPDRSVFMLKFFFGEQASRDSMLAQLRTFRRLYAERLESYEEIRARVEAEGAPNAYTYGALLYGIARAKAAVDWADAVLHDLPAG